MFTKAKPGLLKPKKAIDQVAFKISCIQKTEGTFFFVQTRYKEIPIKIYRIVQTGPKTQFGGEKKGLFKV